MWCRAELSIAQLLQNGKDGVNLGNAVERVDLCEGDFSSFIYNESGALTDTGKGWAVAKDPVSAYHRAVGVKIGTGREAHVADFLVEPGDVAHDGVDADVQDLGIKRGELLQGGVEHRQLGSSSRGPIERMKTEDDVLLAAIIAKLDSKLTVTLNRREVEIRGSVSYLQGHKLDRT